MDGMNIDYGWYGDGLNSVWESLLEERLLFFLGDLGRGEEGVVGGEGAVALDQLDS